MVTDRQAVTACLHSCETVIVGLTVVGYTVKKLREKFGKLENSIKLVSPECLN